MIGFIETGHDIYWLYYLHPECFDSSTNFLSNSGAMVLLGMLCQYRTMYDVTDASSLCLYILITTEGNCIFHFYQNISSKVFLISTYCCYKKSVLFGQPLQFYSFVPWELGIQSALANLHGSKCYGWYFYSLDEKWCI